MANPEKFAIKELARNGSINLGASEAVDTDGVVPIEAKGLTDRLFIRVDNAAGAILNVTIKAGANPPSHLARDIAVAVPASTGDVLIGPFESQRVCQANGDINVEFEAASSTPNAAVTVYRLPKF